MKGQGKLDTNIKILNSKYYGAEELKTNYKKYFAKGLIAAVAVHIVLTAAYLIFNIITLNAEEQTADQKTLRQITVQDIEYPVVIESKEVEVDEPQAPAVENVKKIVPVKDLKALEVEPVKSTLAEEKTVKTQSQLQNTTNYVSRTGDSTRSSEIASNDAPVVIPDKVKKEVEVKKEEVKKEVVEKPKTEVKSTYNEHEVEKSPVALNLGAVKSSMQYPLAAKEAGIEGRVTVRVLVSSNGSVVQVGKVSGPSAFHDAVSSGARNLKFTPGIQAGKPVKVWVTVPFNFRLE